MDSRVFRSKDDWWVGLIQGMAFMSMAGTGVASESPCKWNRLQHVVPRNYNGGSMIRSVGPRGSPMRNVLALIVVLVPSVAAIFGGNCEAATSNGYLDAGVGTVDITPTDPVVLAGSPETLKSSSVGSRLYVRALVFAAGGQKLAIVTLDTLKYPVEHVVRARQQIERTTGIPASNVIICASHTHRGPLWPYYKDALVTPIAEAVGRAVRDLTPCRLGTSKGKAEGVSECRRVIKDGKAWGRWLLPPGEARKYPAEGPADPDFDVLAVIGKDGRYKTVVYGFACHAAYTRELVVSADYPGDVQQYVQKHLGYDVQTMFLAGACGDVNPAVYSMEDAAFWAMLSKRGVPGEANPAHGDGRDVFGKNLGGEIVRCLGRLQPIANPALRVECREMAMPGRERPEFSKQGRCPQVARTDQALQEVVRLHEDVRKADISVLIHRHPHRR